LRPPFAQADDAGESVDHGEAAADRPGDQQPAIVGAEIDRAIGVTVMIPPRLESRFRRPARCGSLMLQSRRTGDTLRHFARFCPSPPKNGG
jgi:hypothetical protein